MTVWEISAKREKNDVLFFSEEMLRSDQSWSGLPTKLKSWRSYRWKKIVFNRNSFSIDWISFQTKCEIWSSMLIAVQQAMLFFILLWLIQERKKIFTNFWCIHPIFNHLLRQIVDTKWFMQSECAKSTVESVYFAFLSGFELVFDMNETKISNQMVV